MLVVCCFASAFSTTVPLKHSPTGLPLPSPDYRLSMQHFLTPYLLLRLLQQAQGEHCQCPYQPGFSTLILSLYAASAPSKSAISTAFFRVKALDLCAGTGANPVDGDQVLPSPLYYLIYAISRYYRIISKKFLSGLKCSLPYLSKSI